MAERNPHCVVEDKPERAKKSEAAFESLNTINNNYQDFYKRNLAGYYTSSPNNSYIKSITERLEKVVKQLKEVTEDEDSQEVS